jgi:hypothetical protein
MRTFTCSSPVLLAAVLLVGCGSASERDPAASSTGEAPAATSATSDTEGVDPAAADGESAEQRACVAELAEGLPDAIADLMEDLGYREALEEACEAQRAVREGDEAGCDSLTASALRAGCRRRLAVRHGRPDACPRVLDLGREPACLAWATRAPARCAAAVGTQGLLCRAPFEGNVELCRELGVERAPCEGAVERFGPSLTPREQRALPAVSGGLEARYVADRPTPGEAPAAGLELPVELDLARGVYVRRADCRATVVLAPDRHGIALRSLRVAPFLLEVGALRGALRDETLEASEALRVGLHPIPGGPQPLTAGTDAETARLDAELARTEGEVQVVTLDPRRGGEVSLVVDVRVPAVGGVYRLSGVLHTYVRDVDPVEPAECQPAPGLL